MEQDICGCYRPAPSAAPPSPLREAACDEEALLDLPACEWMIRDRNGTSLISMGNHLLSGPSVAEMHTHHALEISCVPSGSKEFAKQFHMSAIYQQWLELFDELKESNG